MQATKILETLALGNDKTQVTLLRFMDGQTVHFVAPIGRDTFRHCLNQWRAGVTIQNALPDLDADQREMLLTGITPSEWEEMFKDE